MKKRMLFSMMVVLIIAATSIWSCSKEHLANSVTTTDVKHSNTATLIEMPENMNKALPYSSQGENLYFKLQAEVGHNYSDCGGKCVTTITGITTHIPCQGAGKVCNVVYTMQMPPSPKPFTSVTQFVESTKPAVEAIAVYEDELTTEPTFQFPSRSFLVGIDELHKNEELWLNIPEQVLERSPNNLFIFKHVFYSDHQVYPNL